MLPDSSLPERPLPPWLVAWWRHGDTGLSSYFVAAVLSGSAVLVQITEPHAPSDVSDVGRCVDLLDKAAAHGEDWRAKMGASRLGALCPEWARLLPHWAEIEAAYREDVAAQRAWNAAHPHHHSFQRGKSRRALAHNAVRATFPPSRCWWRIATLTEDHDPYATRTPHPFADEGVRDGR